MLQGEREMAAYNKSLGKFHLTGHPARAAWCPQIEVTFDIDANGIVNVSAKDTATGKEQKITITGTTNLDNSEIDKMVEQAQRHAEEDKARLEEAEARNKADSLVYQTEKTLKEHGEKLPEGDRKAVEDALKELKEALEGSDISRIKSGTEVLTQASYRLAEHMYKDVGGEQAAGAGEAGAAAGAAGAAGGETETDDSDVVDAEFTEVKDEDK